MTKKRAPIKGGDNISVMEHRVLIFAPTGSDARFTLEFLGKNNLPAKAFHTVPELCHEVPRGCGVIVLAEEALAESSILILVQTLDQQASWSDIPVVIITSGGEVGQTRLRRLNIFGPGGNVTVLERPFRPATLVSTVEVALRSRQRQYEARTRMHELRDAHDEAQAASRAKDDFLAALSHELRTPLNPALLIASESAADRQLPYEVRQNFDIIRKHIELEARLIDDLLDLTRVTAGKMVLENEAVDIHDILRDALAIVEGDRLGKQIRLTTHFDAENSFVNGDAVRLKQVCWNILKNAVKFTPADGKITVNTSATANALTVQVADTGIGLKTDEIARVFDAFTQGDHANGGGSHRFGGLGLGLAITKNLVELHAGKISAQSAGPHQGAVFTITLPLTTKAKNKKDFAADSEGEAAPQTTVAPLAPLSVLLVEDHAATRAALAHLLVRRNYKVTEADSIAGARAIAEQNRFDLLISDIGLPDGNGNDLMKEFHDAYGLKGIALTGYGMEEDIARGKAAGFVTHLIKPVRIQTLESALALLKT